MRATISIGLAPSWASIAIGPTSAASGHQRALEFELKFEQNKANPKCKLNLLFFLKCFTVYALKLCVNRYV
jgi:hypothetical protein